MKWYKKQLDKLNVAKAANSQRASGHSFGAVKRGNKKSHKPGEKRSRPKTDAIS